MLPVDLCDKKLQTHMGLKVHRKVCRVVTGKPPPTKQTGRHPRPRVTCFVCGKSFKGTKVSQVFFLLPTS